jgi:diadenosine tetraphosphate (Ap4A) HIT family hydrolase
MSVPMPESDCPFCPPPEARVLWRGEHVLAIWDLYPVAKGHALLIPQRHVVSWAEATAAEQTELALGIAAVRAVIEREHAPDGYNFGVNDGIAAGQSVMHLHLHVIPRYAGDMEDPRGGIRWVVKTPAGHWPGAH